MTIAPASSRRRTTPTMRLCASSTTRLRCGGWKSISSRSSSAPRSDMLPKIRPRTSSLTPRRAIARSFWSTSLSTIWIERSSSLTTSSKVNSRRRISSASSESALASSSSTLRSVVRSEELRMSASDLMPPAAAYSCAPTADSRERMTFSTWLTTSGRVSPIIAIRSATSAWISVVDLREHLRGEHGVQVGDHQRDGLRRLVAQEDDDLLGRRAAQELERAALDRGREAADDLVRAILAQRAHQDAAGEVDAALGEVVLGEHGLDGLGDDVAADLGRDLLGLGELEREHLDLGLAQELEDLARALLADRDEQGGGLLDALELGLGRRRRRRTGWWPVQQCSSV